MDDVRMGLDTGTNSLAVVWNDGIEFLGSSLLTFTEPFDVDKKNGSETSRQAAFSTIRRGKRTRDRKKRSKQKTKNLFHKRGIKFNIDEKMNCNIYEIRDRAADINRSISLEELGQICYNIANRRGFKSNSKHKLIIDSPDVGKSIKTLIEKLESSSYPTLGSYFYNEYFKKNKKIRGSSYTSRKMYHDEFDVIWEIQSDENHHGKDILNDDFYKELEDAIFFQRPLKSQSHRVGHCELFPDEFRCRKNNLYYAQFIIFDKINSIRYYNEDMVLVSLNQDQRNKLYKLFSEKSVITFSQMKKKLGLSSVKFNYESGGKKSLPGNPFESQVRKIIGAKEWKKLSIEQKEDLNTSLLEAESDDIYERYVNDFGHEAAVMLSCIDLPIKHGNLSLKAIHKILPHLKDGKTISTIIKELRDKEEIPIPEKVCLDRLDITDAISDLTNSAVRKSLQECVKAINKGIDKFGKPSSIVVETSRELKSSSVRRQEIYKQNMNRERDRNKIKKELKEKSGAISPSRKDIERYELWKEQGEICILSGKEIPLRELLTSKLEVDHIVPQSKYYDDRRTNKILVLRSENKRKNDRFICDCYSSKERDDIFNRLPKGYPQKKRESLFSDKINVGFYSRQGTDNSYVSSFIKEHLQRLGDETKIESVSGRVVQELRYCWGLPKKDRDYHKHHLEDAAIISCLDSKMIRKINKYFEYKKEGDKLDIPKPWETFVEDVERLIGNTITKHTLDGSIKGKFDQDTIYGCIKMIDENGDVKTKYPTKVKLENLKKAMVNRIIDPKIRQIVKKRVISSAKKNFEDITKKDMKEALNEKNPLYMKCKNGGKRIIKSVRVFCIGSPIAVKKLSNGKEVYKLTGSNHHIEAFINEKGKYDLKVISMFEIYKRKREKSSVVSEYGMDEKFLFSLVKNSTVLYTEDDGIKNYYRVQKFTSNGPCIQLINNNYAGKALRNGDLLFHEMCRSIGKTKIHRVEPVQIPLLQMVGNKIIDVESTKQLEYDYV